jgi:hypothetical protein
MQHVEVEGDVAPELHRQQRIEALGADAARLAGRLRLRRVDADARADGERLNGRGEFVDRRRRVVRADELAEGGPRRLLLLWEPRELLRGVDAEERVQLLELEADARPGRLVDPRVVFEADEQRVFEETPRRAAQLD